MRTLHLFSSGCFRLDTLTSARIPSSITRLSFGRSGQFVFFCLSEVAAERKRSRKLGAHDGSRWASGLRERRVFHRASSVAGSSISGADAFGALMMCGEGEQSGEHLAVIIGERERASLPTWNLDFMMAV